jgi:hypothetical protein
MAGITPHVVVRYPPIEGEMIPMALEIAIQREYPVPRRSSGRESAMREFAAGK